MEYLNYFSKKCDTSGHFFHLFYSTNATNSVVFEYWVHFICAFVGPQYQCYNTIHSYNVSGRWVLRFSWNNYL